MQIIGAWKLPEYPEKWDIEFTNNGEWKEVGWGNPLTSGIIGEVPRLEKQAASLK